MNYSTSRGKQDIVLQEGNRIYAARHNYKAANWARVDRVTHFSLTLGRQEFSFPNVNGVELICSTGGVWDEMGSIFKCLFSLEALDELGLFSFHQNLQLSSSEHVTRNASPWWMSVWVLCQHWYGSPDGILDYMVDVVCWPSLVYHERHSWNGFLLLW